MSKFKSDFSEVQRDYALGELCREILDEDQSELKNLKNHGNGELPFKLGELVGEYLKGRCNAGEMPHLCAGRTRSARAACGSLIGMSFCAVHTAMITATHELRSYTFVCYYMR